MRDKLFSQEELEKMRVTIGKMSPEERQKLQSAVQSQLQGKQGGNMGSSLLAGVSGGLKAIPNVLGFSSKTTLAAPSFYEKEMFKQKLKQQERGKTVGIVHPTTGEVTETETDADVILKGTLEKEAKGELTFSDLEKAQKLLVLDEPRGEMAGGFGGWGGTQQYTSDQKLLREQTRNLINKYKQQGVLPETTGVSPEPTGAEVSGEDKYGFGVPSQGAGAEVPRGGQDEFGFIIGEERTKGKKHYKYVGNDQWEPL